MSKWIFIDPAKVIPDVFGFRKVIACKVKKFTDDYDVRNFSLNGWHVVADVMDYDPVTGKLLNQSSWYVFAAKGESHDLTI